MKLGRLAVGWIRHKPGRLAVDWTITLDAMPDGGFTGHSFERELRKVAALQSATGSHMSAAALSGFADAVAECQRKLEVIRG